MEIHLPAQTVPPLGQPEPIPPIATRAQIQRHRAPGMNLIAVKSAPVSELHLTLTPVAAESPAAMVRRLARAMAAWDATIVRQIAFGSTNTQPAILAAFKQASAAPAPAARDALPARDSADRGVLREGAQRCPPRVAPGDHGHRALHGDRRPLGHGAVGQSRGLGHALPPREHPVVGAPREDPRAARPGHDGAAAPGRPSPATRRLTRTGRACTRRTPRPAPSGRSGRRGG